MNYTVKEILEASFTDAAKAFPGVKPLSEILPKKKPKPTTYGRGEEPEDEKDDEKKNESAEYDKAKYEFLAQKAENKSDDAKGSEKSGLHLEAARAHINAVKNCDNLGYIREHIAAVHHHLNKIK